MWLLRRPGWWSAGNLPARELDAGGRIELSGAEIAGTVDFSYAHVRDPGGQAVAAERISVGDHLNFTGLTSEGQVMLRGARIDRQLLFAWHIWPIRAAMCCTPAPVTVGDSLYLWRGFTADGEIVLRRTHINGGAHIDAAGPVNLDASNLTADLFHLQVADPAASAVSLRQASVGSSAEGRTNGLAG